MYSHTLYERYREVKKIYFKAEVETNSILPTAFHITDGLWFIAFQNSLTFTVVWPQKQKETLDCKPNFGNNKTNHVLYCYK